MIEKTRLSESHLEEKNAIKAQSSLHKIMSRSTLNFSKKVDPENKGLSIRKSVEAIRAQ